MDNFSQLPLFSKQQQNRLPDFIIIGGMKCGTTSLHYYLNCHPDISMSREKELKFFVESCNWNKGIEWYKSQFTGNAKIYGEASPAYTKYPVFTGVAKRMYSLVPHAKLIYIVRDPIERIISHYIHHYSQRQENRPITEALADFKENPHNIYVCRSRYYWQLEQYLSYFPSQNILIITTEELRNYPQKTLEIILTFLGVSPNTSSINYTKKIHESANKRRKTNLGNRIARLPVFNKIDSLPSRLEYHLDQLLYFPFSKPVIKPILNQDLQQQLIDYLRDDINCLRQYTQKNFNEWCL